MFSVLGPDPFAPFGESSATVTSPVNVSTAFVITTLVLNHQLMTIQLMIDDLSKAKDPVIDPLEI